MLGLNVGIIGGSVSGCAAAILLWRLGAKPTVLERSSRPLIGRGAGIVAPENNLKEGIALDLFDKNIPQLPIEARSFFTNDKKIWEQSLHVRACSWNDIYSNLRKRIPDEHYHANQEVCAVNQSDGVCHVETIAGKKYTFDLIIVADGINSSIRQQIFPNSLPQYANYIAWRGITTLPPAVEQNILDAHLPYFVFPNGHFILYQIPAPDYQNTKRKRVNWLFYEDGKAFSLPDLLHDKNGVQHDMSLPPGSLSVQHIQHLHARAKKVLPAKIFDIIGRTESPFLQAIYDFQIPQYVKNRICFVGDAAAVVRPHAASGVLKSLNDAVSLAKQFETNNLKNISASLSAWNESQLKIAQQQVALGKCMGEALVTNTPDWNKMDFESMEKWWQEIMEGKSWYATSPQPRY